MSFLINWDLLNDGQEAEALRSFLNARFRQIDLPPFLGPLQVTELDFGDVPPEVAVIDICDPAPEFYLPEDPEIWRPSTPPSVPGFPGLGGRGPASSVMSGDEWDTGYEGTVDDRNEDTVSESYFYGAPHSQGGAYDHMESTPDEHEMSSLAAARNLSYDNFGYLADQQRPVQRQQPARPVFSPPPSFSRSPTYSYGSRWSGHIGLGLGLGLSSPRPPATTSNHSHSFSSSSIPHFRPAISSAPPSIIAHSFATTLTASTTFSDTPEIEIYPPPSPRILPPAPPVRPMLTDHQVAESYADGMRRQSDAQVEFEVVYKGNMRLAIQTELIVNQPTPGFMVLPLVLTLTGFHFTASALISYLGDRVNFCFKESDAGSTILHDVSIDSEVGDGRKQGVLKNVGRIERFIVEQLRKVIQDFLVFPNHQSLKLFSDPQGSGVGHGVDGDFASGSEGVYDDGQSYDEFDG
ncbi:Mitochondrial distribution and morphology protein 12 [Thoreauomyces humboldtii]|nr:Mitochondrial distribution and morphology protein 12 [Thoreauomyces humboldtii]